MPRQTLKAVQDQIRKLQAKAEALAEKNKRPALATIVALMRDNEISLEEVSAALGKRRGRKPKAATVAARPVEDAGKTRRTKPGAPRKNAAKSTRAGRAVIKYRHPDTEQTWSGRGRTPRWIAEAEAAGQERDQFKV